VYDVTARDGIQNEKTVLSVETKKKLLQRIVEANPCALEACSFVREDLVPAMAGAVELCESLRTEPWAAEAKERGMQFGGLVPNMKGFESFCKANDKGKVLDFVTCLVSCTESHSQANVRMSLDKAMKTTLSVVENAKAEGFGVRAYASLAFVCPFEGDVDPNVVLDIVQMYSEAGADKIILADTLGKATPEQVEEVLEKVLKSMPEAARLGLHMHDAHGRAGENIATALQLGIPNFDASLGGAGGCNFVPDAKGNVSTQKVLSVLEHFNVPHALNKQVVLGATKFLSEALGRDLDMMEPEYKTQSL